MSQNRLHQSLADASSAELANHKYISQVRKDRAIRDHPREGDLLAARIYAEAQGIPNRPLDRLATTALSPIRSTQEFMHERDIKAARVARSFVLAESIEVSRSAP